MHSALGRAGWGRFAPGARLAGGTGCGETRRAGRQGGRRGHSPRTARPGPRAPEDARQAGGGAPRAVRTGRAAAGPGREAGRGPHEDAPSPRPLAATWRARCGCRAPSAPGCKRLGPAAAPNFPGDGSSAGAPRRGASTFRPPRAPSRGQRRLGGSGPVVSLRDPQRTPASRGAGGGRPARRPGSSFQQRLCVAVAPSSLCSRSPPRSPRDETRSPDARWARFWKTPCPGEGARLVPARRQPRGHLRAGTRPGRPSPRPAAVRVLRRQSPRPGAGARIPIPCPAAPGRGAHWTRGEGTRSLRAAGAELAVAWGAGWRSPASDLGAPLIPAAADVRRVPEGPARVFN